MSFLARALRRAPQTSSSPTKAITASSFHSISLRSSMGESDRAKDTPNLQQKREADKQDSVQKAKQGKGEWKPELASDSEQSVAGEKMKMSMEEMQRMGELKGKEDGGKP